MSDVSGAPRLGSAGASIRLGLRAASRAAKLVGTAPARKVPKPAGGSQGGGGSSNFARDIYWKNFTVTGGLASAFVGSACAECIAGMVEFIQTVDIDPTSNASFQEDEPFQRLLLRIRGAVEAAALTRYQTPALHTLMFSASQWVTILLDKDNPAACRIGETARKVGEDANRAAMQFVSLYLESYGERLIRTFPADSNDAQIVEQAVRDYDAQVQIFMQTHNQMVAWGRERVQDTLKEFVAHLRH